MRHSIEWTTENDDGDEVVHDLPAEWQICGRCEGEGKHTPDSLMVITEEERRDWSDEEWASFTSGGYDVVCQDCKGTGKFLAVAKRQLRNTNPKLFQLWSKSEADDAAYRRECAAERRMGA